MSAIDEVLEYSDGTYRTLPVDSARAELAQLHASVAALTAERDDTERRLNAANNELAEIQGIVKAKFISDTVPKVKALREQNAEQARRIDEARHLVGCLLAITNSPSTYDICDAWLSATAPVPQAEQEH